MSETTMDDAAKARVKDALVARARTQLTASAGIIDTEHSAAELDQDSSYAVDDQSQADEAGDLMALYEGNAERQQADLEAVEKLDMSGKQSVQPGAIVGFGGARYVVGVVSDAVECDGVSYEGISTDSPVFAAIDGLGLGDSFTFHDREQRIDFLA